MKLDTMKSDFRQTWGKLYPAGSRVEFEQERKKTYNSRSKALFSFKVSIGLYRFYEFLLGLLTSKFLPQILTQNISTSPQNVPNMCPKTSPNISPTNNISENMNNNSFSRGVVEA